MDLTTIILIGGAIVVIALINGVVVTSRSERSAVDDRLGKYLEDEKPKEEQQASGSGALSVWVNKRVERSSIGEKIARNLARADLKLKSGEFIAMYVIAFLGLGFIAFMIGGRSPISALIGGEIGLFIPGWYVGPGRRSRRRARAHESARSGGPHDRGGGAAEQRVRDGPPRNLGADRRYEHVGNHLFRVAKTMAVDSDELV